MRQKRSRSFYFMGLIFVAYVLFLYGPTLTILLLSFQGPTGGLTLPLQGLSLHWYHDLMLGHGLPNIRIALWNSARLGILVSVLTMVISVMAGLAFRRKFRGASLLLYAAIASLILPSIIVSLGIALEFSLANKLVMGGGDVLASRFGDGHGNFLANGIGMAGNWIEDHFQTLMGLFTSGLGAHLTWTLPFGLLIMFAVFNRFNPSYEEAARDLGATSWQTFRFVVLPLIAPAVIGVALLGFTLSWDEIARSSQAVGSANTLPLLLEGLTTTVTTPVIYALGTLTTLLSLAVIGLALTAFAMGQRRVRGAGKKA
ncbi:MAG: ABC transporter permease subunit [Hyphomicrobiales bacterium]|nr:ABC transporter permease subunit [Hyphomicrobiales bacterium]MDE2115909.1 ABC transporter permease subunit [Hyphomicrobiales bacterium]